MELTINLGLLDVQNKAVLSFVTPLIFSIMLQNLLVKVGGEEPQLDVSEFFQRFRHRVIATFAEDEIAKKVTLWTRIVNLAKSSEKIEKTCQIYAPTIHEFTALQKLISGYPEERKKVEYAKQLVDWMGVEFVEGLLENPKFLAETSD